MNRKISSTDTKVAIVDSHRNLNEIVPQIVTPGYLAVFCVIDRRISDAILGISKHVVRFNMDGHLQTRCKVLAIIQY